jgi:uncharacterized membrane protein
MAAAKNNENIMGAVAYLVFFVSGIILLLTEKSSKSVRFHAMQSTIWFGGLFILTLIPLVNIVLSFIIVPVVFISWLFLMWKAFSGEMYKLPYIGDFAEKQLSKLK